MSEHPKISVVTPSFNQAEYLEKTMLSILSQGYPNLEYIVMDGGSTDGSVEIIKKYESQLAYWRSEPDGGQTAAICEGFSHATGDILLYLNSDDMLMPGSLMAYADALGGQDKAWAIGRLALVDEQDRLLAYRPAYPFCMGDLWYNLYIVHQEGTCYTRALYEEASGFDPSYHYSMDFHMWLRMRELSEPVLLKQYTAAFRVSESQKSADVSAYAKEVNRAFEDARKWRVGRGLPELPKKPIFKGNLFSLAKAVYYFWVGGIDVVRGIIRFRGGREENINSTGIVQANRG